MALRKNILIGIRLYRYWSPHLSVGTPLARLFDGTWQPGEHMVQIPADKLNAGGYLVLRKGNIILNWQLLK
ncbi:MAG: hypothetical protein MJY99_12600 [Fibrobacter sp.]|nr:hypothetical protein [Fibrobacter sp.]